MIRAGGAEHGAGQVCRSCVHMSSAARSRQAQTAEPNRCNTLTRLPLTAGAHRLAARAMSVPVPGTPPRRTDALRGKHRSLSLRTESIISVFASAQPACFVHVRLLFGSHTVLCPTAPPRLQPPTACRLMCCPPSAPSLLRRRMLRPLSLLCPSPSRPRRSPPLAPCHPSPLLCWRPCLRMQTLTAAPLPPALLPPQLPPPRRRLPPPPCRRPGRRCRSRLLRPRSPPSTLCWMPLWCGPSPALRHPSAHPHWRAQWRRGRLTWRRRRALSMAPLPDAQGGPQGLFGALRRAAWKTSG